MGQLAESWDPIAHTLGYKNEAEMLRDLYKTLSIDEIAKKLGYSRGGVRRRLIMLDVDMRGRGGKNNLGMGALAAATDEELANVEKCTANYRVSQSTVFKERKRREQCISVLPPPPSTLSSTGSDIDTLPSPSGAAETQNTSNSSKSCESEETTSS